MALSNGYGVKLVSKNSNISISSVGTDRGIGMVVCFRGDIRASGSRQEGILLSPTVGHAVASITPSNSLHRQGERPHISQT